MSEIAIEEHFSMLRRQSGNSQLTCRAFWQAAARVAIKVGEKLNDEQAAATRDGQAPLTKEEFLGVLQWSRQKILCFQPNTSLNVNREENLFVVQYIWFWSL